jgi:hypothetical protein
MRAKSALAVPCLNSDVIRRHKRILTFAVSRRLS